MIYELNFRELFSFFDDRARMLLLIKRIEGGATSSPYNLAFYAYNFFVSFEAG
tara:strand:- start:1390 stop:1548 length:159 start_codon:yes stop_codon:yes gene_type:complete